MPKRRAQRETPPVPVAAPRPVPAWRDPWAWLSLLGILPLVLHSRGARLGEPVAEDFDYLHRALLEGRGTLFDGGGTSAFWRPVAQQLYYWTLGPLGLTHPRWLAAVHFALLALGALLLYRALRRSWPGWAAAAAATFPLLAESTRSLGSWSSHSADLGLFLFSALAIHEAAFRRWATALAALLAALLCKEMAVVTALLLPFVPSPATRDRRRRGHWALAVLGVVGAWVVAYAVVRERAGLALPHGLESQLGGSADSWAERFAWAAWNSARAIVSLKLVPGPWDLPVLVAALALVGIAIVVHVVRPPQRARWPGVAAWSAWGAAWFVLASIALGSIYPIWGPYRSQFGSVGLGIALVAALGAAHPFLVAALVALRAAAFALAPGPPATVTASPPNTGAFMDFERLTRLQLLMAEVHETMRQRHPRLPRGALVCQHHLPLMSEYAFGGNRALRVWYRDSTLRWVRFEQLVADSGLDIEAIVEYQPDSRPQIVLVEPAAMRRLIAASEAMKRSDCVAAAAALDQADSLQRDKNARVFLSIVAAKRSLCLPDLGENDRAIAEAKRSLELWPDNDESRFTLAYVWLAQGKLDEAQAQVDTLLANQPGDRNTMALNEQIKKARRRTTAP